MSDRRDAHDLVFVRSADHRFLRSRTPCAASYRLGDRKVGQEDLCKIWLDREAKKVEICSPNNRFEREASGVVTVHRSARRQ